MAEFVSLREFARRVGVNVSAVHDSIKAGRIVRDEATKRIDWETQSVAWDKNRDVSKIRDHNAPNRELKDQNNSFMQVKLAKETIAVKLKKMELDEKAGLLIDRAAVEVANYNVARTVRDSILGIPDRVSAEVAGELAKTFGSKVDVKIIERIVHRVFDRESRAVMQQLSKRLDV